MKLVLTSLFVAGAIALAQGPHGPAGHGTRTGASLLDLTKKQTVAGTVTAVDAAYGVAYSSITVNKIQIKTAPIWYLLEKGFEVKTGDAVSVNAAPSKTPGDAYLYALEIVNSTSKRSIALRDANGVPLWTGGAGMAGGYGHHDEMAQGGCLDPATIATASGVIDKISAGIGVQMPSLTVKTADGKLVTVKLGPERILLAEDIELKAGDKITVRYASESCTDELVGLSLTTAGGTVIQLRNEDGTPCW